MLKVGEVRPGVYKGKAKQESNGHGQNSDIVPNGYVGYPAASERREAEGLHSWWYDALELAHSMRGLKWKYGQGVYIPSPDRPQERGPFLWATLRSFVRNFITLDVLESLVKLFPGVGNPTGGSIFYPFLPLPQRLLVATTIHILTGSAILSGFGMVYDLITLIAVSLLHSSPSSWPPVMDNPWVSCSMHEFWSKRWHQSLRQTFLIFGGYPGKWIGGNLGMLFGAFVASGLFHECAMYSMGRGYDHSATTFFAVQAPILLAERLYRKVTGKPMGGWLGRALVYFNLFIVAQPMGESPSFSPFYKC